MNKGRIETFEMLLDRLDKIINSNLPKDDIFRRLCDLETHILINEPMFHNTPLSDEVRDLLITVKKLRTRYASLRWEKE